MPRAGVGIPPGRYAWPLRHESVLHLRSKRSTREWFSHRDAPASLSPIALASKPALGPEPFRDHMGRVNAETAIKIRNVILFENGEE